MPTASTDSPGPAQLCPAAHSRRGTKGLKQTSRRLKTHRRDFSLRTEHSFGIFINTVTSAGVWARDRSAQAAPAGTAPLALPSGPSTALGKASWRHLHPPLLCQGLHQHLLHGQKGTNLIAAGREQAQRNPHQHQSHRWTAQGRALLCESRALSAACAFHPAPAREQSQPSPTGMQDRGWHLCCVFTHTQGVTSSEFGAFSGGLFSVDAKQVQGSCVAEGLWQQLLENSNVFLHELSL